MSKPEGIDPVEWYSSMDVGELYGVIHDKDTTPDQLHAIKAAGINQGHSGIVDLACEELTARELKAKGASEEHQLEYRVAKSQGRLADSLKVLQVYSVKPVFPSQKELDAGLRNAIGYRGFTIHDDGSSVGEFFQNLYGNKFSNITLVAEGTDEDGNKVQKKIPYHELDDKTKEQVNIDILSNLGYIAKQEQESEQAH